MYFNYIPNVAMSVQIWGLANNSDCHGERYSQYYHARTTVSGAPYDGEIRSLLWIFPPNCMEPSCLSRNDDGELPDGLTLVPSSHGRCFGWDFTMSRRSPVIWATNRLGDRRVGDKPTGRQPTGRHILVNWATEVETTGPQLTVEV